MTIDTVCPKQSKRILIEIFYLNSLILVNILSYSFWYIFSFFIKFKKVTVLDIHYQKSYQGSSGSFDVRCRSALRDYTVEAKVMGAPVWGC